MRYRSPRRVVPWGLLRDDPSLGRFGLHPPASTRVYLRDFFTHLFSTRFSTSIFLPLGWILASNLGLCWELFGYIFGLKLRFHVEADFLSIFDGCWTPLAPPKLSSRVGESQIFNIL